MGVINRAYLISQDIKSILVYVFIICFRKHGEHLKNKGFENTENAKK